MEYYYTPKSNINKENNTLTISDEFEYRHLSKVLRKKAGDIIDITDGELNVYSCEITGITKNKINCRILSTEYNLFEPKKRIHLFIAPLKNNDRFEFAVEKAVELGAYSITPVSTIHTINKSEFNETKLKRLHKIIISAMGQSQRCYLPKLNNIITFEELIEETNGKVNRVVMYEFSGIGEKFEYNNSSDDVYLFIGPEGGFSTDEIKVLKDSGWQAGSLGERKLRAETAAIVSIFEIINCN